MSTIEEITLYQTAPHQCSYRNDQLASTLFVDPELKVTPEILTYLSQRGFRRSGEYIYLPNCETCSACISTRLPVTLFTPNRIQKRVWKRNQDLAITLTEPQLTDEIYDLYQRYIETRHADGDMYPATKEQYQSFLVESYVDSFFLEFRLKRRLVAVAVTDILTNAYSAVYTFFEPELTQRSLGVYSLLAQIEHTKKAAFDHLYLGYWVKQCRKMNYKLQYRPIELLVNDQWTLLS